MPTANDEEQELPVPFHPSLDLVTSCKQVFTKCSYRIPPYRTDSELTVILTGSRRLMVYKRIPDQDVDAAALESFLARDIAAPAGISVDELNPFRRRYFAAFRDEDPEA